MSGREKRPLPTHRARLMKPCLLALWLVTPAVMAADSVPERLSIEPPRTVLDGRRASAQLIATGYYADGAVRDLTYEAIWTSADPSIVAVSAGGRITPRGDGQTEVHARCGS